MIGNGKQKTRKKIQDGLNMMYLRAVMALNFSYQLNMEKII